MKEENKYHEIIESLYLDGAFGNKVRGFWSGDPLKGKEIKYLSNGMDMMGYLKEVGFIDTLEFTPAGIVIAGLSLKREAEEEDIISLMGGQHPDSEYVELMKEASIWYAKSVTEKEICLHVEGASPAGTFRRIELPILLSNKNIDTVWNVRREPGKPGRLVEELPIEGWYYPQRRNWLNHTWGKLLTENPYDNRDTYIHALSRLVMEGAEAYGNIDGSSGNLHWNKDEELALLSGVTACLYTQMSPERHIDYAYNSLDLIKYGKLRSAAEKYLKEL